MLRSYQVHFYTIPLNSQTNDGPASSMSSFLFQLRVVPTSNLLHFHVPTNATSTATGLRIHIDSRQSSLNDVTIVHVSAKTATTTAKGSSLCSKKCNNKCTKISAQQMQSNLSSKQDNEPKHSASSRWHDGSEWCNPESSFAASRWRWTSNYNDKSWTKSFALCL